MNANRHPIARLLLTAIASLAAHSHACAQTPLTRAEVIAQYREAQRTGDLLAPGDSGLKLNEIAPDRYPKTAAATSLTRDQVVAELQAAIRSGDVVAPGDSGMKLNELYPGRYPAAMAVAGKTREQVRAETLESIRTGDMQMPGDSGLKQNEVAPTLYHRLPETRRAVAEASSHMPN
jgi:uncharacterized membrane protein